MHAALNSGVGNRNNIWSAQNLINTGVNNPDEFCKAEFGSNIREVCVGTPVNFDDLSFDNPTTWNWSFPGASPATSMSQNPTVTYNTPGTYAVTLTASDGSVTDTETKTGFITVLPQYPNLPFLESFVNNDLPGDYWERRDFGGSSSWTRTALAGYTDNNSAFLFNFGQQSGNIDEFLSQSFDLSNVDPNEGVTMSFRYAYRKRQAANYEILRVYISNDCGETWSQRKILFGTQLGDQVSSSMWIPSTQDDWVTVHVNNITSQYWTDNLRVKFQFESDGGNNIFIDDINIYDGEESEELVSSTDDEEDLIRDFVVFPNPTAGEVNVSFSSDEATTANIRVLDLVSKVVTERSIQTVLGQNEITLANQLASGTYMVNVSLADGSQQTKKLIVR